MREEGRPWVGGQILALHKVQSGLTFGSTNYSPDRLGRLLAGLEAVGFYFASVDEVISGTARPKAVALTFDDAYQHLTTTLPPLMAEFGFSPTVFVPTGYLGKQNRWDYSNIIRPDPHMTSNDIEMLSAAGVRFGSHGHWHVDLTSLSSGELLKEVIISKEVLGKVTGLEITQISYPFGAVNERVMEACRAAGYRQGFTMRFSEAGDDPLAIGRFGVWGFDTLYSVLQKLNHGGLYPIEHLKGRITHGLSAGTSLLNRIRSTVGGDGSSGDEAPK